MRRVEFHYIPKHASWLNMAEIEIGILDRQCIGRRIAHAALVACPLNPRQARVRPALVSKRARRHSDAARRTRLKTDRSLRI